MMPMPGTRESLLIRLGDSADARSWQQFVAIYRPMVYRVARRRGLQDSDAEDLTQKVLLSVSQAIGNWKKDPQRGTFRAWLNRVAHNAIINYVTRGPQDVAVGGTDFLTVCQKVESPADDVEQLIREEYARSSLRVAAELVKANVTASTWKAFWETAVHCRPVAEVATQLGMSHGAIYGARGRVMKQLQAAAETMKQEHGIGAGQDGGRTRCV